MLQRLSNKFGTLRDSIDPSGAARRDLLAHVHEYIVPHPPPVADSLRNMPATRLDPPALDLRADEQLERLESFRSARHARLFDALRKDPVINRLGLGTERVSNVFCNTPDAEIYGSMILECAPRQVVEVGSGFSTLVARKTVEVERLDTKIVVIDPHPRTDVSSVSDEVLRLPVERTDLLSRRWAAGDILFIDSSHICRTRGDLPYLFCQVLPSLPPGVRVHVHDIFLPYDYPNLYDQWCHTEQYLLACMLSHSSRYRVVMATHWLSREHAARMNSVFGPYAGSELSSPDHFGCSFWFDVSR